jgi:hypothetical protein
LVFRVGVFRFGVFGGRVGVIRVGVFRVGAFMAVVLNFYWLAAHKESKVLSLHTHKEFFEIFRLFSKTLAN